MIDDLTVAMMTGTSPAVQFWMGWMDGSYHDSVTSVHLETQRCKVEFYRLSDYWCDSSFNLEPNKEYSLIWNRASDNMDAACSLSLQNCDLRNCAKNGTYWQALFYLGVLGICDNVYLAHI